MIPPTPLGKGDLGGSNLGENRSPLTPLGKGGSIPPTPLGRGI